jgi:probable F420-dependent oxidoreductase
MQFGLGIFPTEYTLAPDELARRAEDRGFDSLWVTEHSHIPVDRKTPWPGGPVLPREYLHTYDPFVALTAAAAASRRIKLATGICLLVQRDPIITAKEVASLDRLSGGRFIFGVGGGWNLDEIENHGTDPRRRFAVLRERLLAMKALWTQDEAEFHGPLCRLWQGVVIPQAPAAAASARLHGRRRTHDLRPRDRALRRLAADLPWRRPAAGDRVEGAGLAPASGRGRP